MRINCPYCGERWHDEFTVLGDADALKARPASPDVEAFYDYVYLRRNPAGPHRELWYHHGGCRKWLVVDRDTRTHAVNGVRLACEGGEAQ